ncbi:MAG: hypothetical protein JOY71_16515 [Acetobacteraceae bacterium]|nr:hypothetical protein [Acetobacteraceae bacterium]MBV8590598.1 hypothetical protein [Acetobacteraceae bacterium]
MRQIGHLAGRSLVALIFASAVLATGGSRSANAQAGTYTIDGNGFLGSLTLQIDGQGNVTGSVYSQPIFGFYDAGSRHLIFERVISQTDLTQNQIFDGYIWTIQNDPNCVEAGGTFQFFSGTGGNAVFNRQGWRAEGSSCPP